MSQIFKKCPVCGNTLTIYEKNKNTQCKKCMAEFDTESILDADERTFLKSFSDDKLENTLRYNALIIQANENIEKGLFEVVSLPTISTPFYCKKIRKKF